MALIRALARPLLAAPFALSGAARLRAPETTAAHLRPLLARVSRAVPALRSVADRPQLVARGLGGVQLASGVLLALGRMPRLSAALIVVAQALTAASEPVRPEDSAADRAASLAVQAGLTGGALLATVDHDARRRTARRAKKALA